MFIDIVLAHLSSSGGATYEPIFRSSGVSANWVIDRYRHQAHPQPIVLIRSKLFCLYDLIADRRFEWVYNPRR
jgi:hypothetical protein